MILALLSFYFMPVNYLLASLLYLVGVLLDDLDGWAARRYNQGMALFLNPSQACPHTSQ